MTPRVVGASYSYGFHSDTFVRQVPGRVSTVCFAEDHSLALASLVCAYRDTFEEQGASRLQQLNNRGLIPLEACIGGAAGRRACHSTW